MALEHFRKFLTTDCSFAIFLYTNVLYIIKINGIHCNTPSMTITNIIYESVRNDFIYEDK